MVPAILISERDAVLLKNLIEKGERVILSIDIDSTETKSDIATLEYYIMINDPLSYNLLHKIHSFRFDSYGLLKFKPIYAFKNLQGQSQSNTQNCFNNNRYCIHAEKSQPYKTKEYRDETIRQICLWQQHKNSMNLEKQWWKYMEAFSKICLDNSILGSLKECSDRAFELSGVDSSVITSTQNCFDKYANNYDRIPIIDDQMKSPYDFEQYPGIVVNDNLVRGYRSKKSIITSVCDAYTRKPSACQQYELKLESYSYARNASVWHVYVILIVCALVLSTAVIFIKNYMSGIVGQDIEMNVRDHVHTYYKISEADRRMGDTELRPDETG